MNIGNIMASIVAALATLVIISVLLLIAYDNGYITQYPSVEIVE